MNEEETPDENEEETSDESLREFCYKHLKKIILKPDTEEYTRLEAIGVLLKIAEGEK